MATDEARLLVRLEASATKLVSEMKRASDVTRAKMAEIDGAVTRSNKRVTEGVGRAAVAYRQGASSSKAFGFAAQNAAFQLGDFAVQVGGGVTATRALAQQLPQLLGGFGVVGAIAGAAAAIALPLASSFFAAGEEIKKIDAMSLDQVRSRIEELTGLQEAYNEIVRQSGPVQTNATREKLSALDEEYQAKLALFRLDAITLEQRQRQLEQTLAAQREEVSEIIALASLDEKMRAQEAGDTGMRDRLASIVEMIRASAELLGQNEDLALEVRRQNAELDLVNLSLADVQNALSGAVSLAGDLASGMSLVAAEASRAAAAAASIARYETVSAGYGSGPDAVRSRLQGGGLFVTQPTGAGLARLKVKGGRGGGGRGKADSDPRAFLNDRIEAAQRSAEAARIEAESILHGAEAAAVAKARFELLAEAKKKNLDLDKAATAGGVTLRAEIDRQAAAIGALTVEADRYREQAQFLQGATQDLQDGFIDAVIEGKNFGEVLQGLAKDIARAALQAALFNQGPFAGGGGGSVLGGALSGLFGGFRAEGGPVSPGKAYVVGERGPEVMVPRTKGTVLPNLGGALSKVFGGFRAEGGPVSPGKAYVVGERGPEVMVPRTKGTVLPNLGGALTVEVDRHRAGADALQGATQDLKDGFIDAVIEGKNFGAVLQAVTKDIARAAIFNKGPFAGPAQDVVAGGAMSGSFGGFRAKGGPVSPGKAYVVGERGPELMVPNTKGSIVPNLRGAGGGSMHVTVGVDGSGNLQATIARISGQVSAQVVGSAMSRQQSQLGQIQGNQAQRGTR